MKKQVKCIETGEVYPSIIACAKVLGVSDRTLGEHIRFKDPVKGLHFIKI